MENSATILSPVKFGRFHKEDNFYCERGAQRPDSHDCYDTGVVSRFQDGDAAHGPVKTQPVWPGQQNAVDGV